MIKMISGVYGMPVLNKKGETVSVKRVGPEYGPFTLPADKEARLVSRGVAAYVEPPVMHEQDDGEDAPDAVVDVPGEDVGDIGPIGFDDIPELPEGVTAIPEYGVEMKASELREIGKMCGLTFKVGMKKEEMVAALDKHIEENMVDGVEINEDGEIAVDDDEPAPHLRCFRGGAVMGFKDMVSRDRMAVFLDLDTFGERLRVEGKEIPVVLDTDTLKEKQGGQDLAVAESSTLFFARVEDLPKRRSPGNFLNVNGRECVIDEWTENMGIATVVLRETVTG